MIKGTVANNEYLNIHYIILKADDYLSNRLLSFALLYYRMYKVCFADYTFVYTVMYLCT